MSDVYPALSSEVQGYINQLKAKGAEFAQAYQVHLSNYEKVKDNPELLAKWESIKTYADNVKGVIQTVNSAVDSSANWLKDIFGLAGVSALPVGGFVLSAAYLISALAALTWIIGQIYQFNVLVNKGATVDQLTKNTFSGIGDIVKWGAIAFGIYVLWQKFGKGK